MLKKQILPPNRDYTSNTSSTDPYIFRVLYNAEVQNGQGQNCVDGLLRQPLIPNVLQEHTWDHSVFR
ncbi:MAG: hypothetical protein ABGZ23_11525 [Fuerstiella sp.]